MLTIYCDRNSLYPVILDEIEFTEQNKEQYLQQWNFSKPNQMYFMPAPVFQFDI